MKGYTQDGKQVELLDWQESAVRAFAAWDAEHPFTLPARARGAGKSTVVATLAYYDTHRAELYEELRKHREDRTGLWYTEFEGGPALVSSMISACGRAIAQAGGGAGSSSTEIWQRLVSALKSARYEERA